ncbi:signal transduction histidine kinase [Methanosalsum zhilinae DSM 4017]|uniref:Signal transduction histidine kinase n=1 Tax=Methanosalsum zhilinae (strain DSM 4017 / NBRC 107636 / OCM 62 / WeN5) TaxID=679901 RepID=F7XL59_METZD|nr:PAS domain S-box protein [Methanosalsum zhilinae]AEH60009.1 signal transduction histidine kinase [Methanosalsum zhilinae DSM 4017]
MSIQSYRKIIPTFFSDNMMEAYSYCKIISDESGIPYDYEILEINSKFEEVTGLQSHEIIGKRITEVVPDIRDGERDWVEFLSNVALNGNKKNFDFFCESTDKFYHGTAFSPQKGYFVALFVENSKENSEIEENEMLLHLIDGTIIELNENYICTKTITSNDELLFLPKDQIIGKGIRDIFPTVSENIISAIEKSAIKGEKEYFEYSSFESNEHKWFGVEVRYFQNKDRKKFVLKIRDITKQKLSELEILSSKEELNRYFKVNLDLLCIADTEGNFHHLNEEWSNLFGYSIEELKNKKICDFVHPEDIESTNEVVKKLKKQQKIANFVNRCKCKDGSYKYIEWKSHPYGDFIYAAARDITDKQQIENNRILYSKILSILNEPIDIDESLSKMLSEIKYHIGADAIGIRLRQKDDYPYIFQKGFSNEFLTKENTLKSRNVEDGICRNEDGSICLECTCGLVITGSTDPCNPLFTEYGSACTNNSFPFLEVPENEDPRYNPRNQCIHEGYASVAIIPIKIKNRIIGTLQLNGYSKGLFTSNDINLLEDIAANIGQSLQRKQIESQLKEVHKRLDAFLENTPLIVSEISLDGRYQYVNKFLCDLFDKSKDEIIGNKFEEMMPEETAKQFKQRMSEVSEKSSHLVVEDTISINGIQRTFRTVLFPLHDESMKIKSIGSIGEDITDHKKIKELEQNRLIVHEIHHRVKNNLQVISSLLNMQARLFKDDKKIQNVFSDSQNRIRSMSIAHENLYRSDSVASIEISEYITSLVNHIRQTYNSYDKSIETKLNLDQTYLNMDYIVPLGLILNEIITNSYKHAFVGTNTGIISVSFKELENIYQIIVSDNGIGIKQDLNCNHSNSLGMKIINLLSKQLSAEIELDNSNGTCYTIKINKND